MASLADRLKKILIRDELISAEELQQALDEQARSGGELGKILLQKNLIEERALLQAFSELLHIPVIKIDKISIETQALQSLPQNLIQKHKIIPISLLGDQLSICASYPPDVFILDDIKMLTGYSVQTVLSTSDAIEAAIKNQFERQSAASNVEASPRQENQVPAEEASDTMDAIIADIRDTEDLELVGEAAREAGNVEDLTDEAPIIKLTDTVIQQAVLAKASDVFIEPMESTVRIRYRVDGIIREIDRLAKVLHFPLISRIKVIANLDISEHRLPQDGRFKTVFKDHAVDFRVNVLPTAYGEKICLRVLDQAAKVLDVEGLGFEPKALERLKECAVKPHGMILTCGPTGSGKTTTLYSVLSYVDSPEKNIVTVEDPVEYQMKGMTQVNIKSQMGLTFPVALRSILRQDPDIIMIGEIRDSETMDIAVKAALTGHLVLSSLHTTTAAGSIVRMINMGVQPFLICSSVLAIVAQRLIRRVCSFCKEEYALEPEMIERVGFQQIANKKEITLVKGKGCKKCMNTGYKGRVGITEILIFSPKVRELILASAGEAEIKEAARQEGMMTMREDGLKKALCGLTTLEEVLRVTASDDMF